MKFEFESCEKAIGYVFNDKNLLIQCFTHSSFTNENSNYPNNERLEFLGDSILGFIVTEFLFEKHKKKDEGELTTMKQNVVSKKPLSRASIEFGFDKFLLLGEGEKKSSASKVSLCENLFEAIIAGIYLDGGLEKAKEFVYSKLLSSNLGAFKEIDHKGKLQEYVQKHKLGDISYDFISCSGPSHKPLFKMNVSLNGEIMASGEGESKKKAEQVSAQIALKKLTTLRNN